MTKEQLIHIIKEGENETVEFKQAFSKAIFETIVAFSNNTGGKILIGIDDSGNVIDEFDDSDDDDICDGHDDDYNKE